jgi:hypothetical protein
LSSGESNARVSEYDRRVVLLVLAALGMFILVGGVFLAEHLSENRARRYLLTAVTESSGVIVNGRRLSDPSVVLNALRGIRRVPAHHSSPSAPIHLLLEGGPEPVGIIIARDSNRPHEFWVYRPGSNWHNDPLGQDAGRILSGELDGFLRSRGL